MLALLLSWHFHQTSLTTVELQSSLKPVRPPPEPVAVEEDYSTHRAKPCTKADPVIDTTICDILKAPQTFASQCVRVTGRFLTDGLEHSVIVDESCKGGLEPWGSDVVTEKLDSVIWPSSGPGTFDRRVTAQFTGRLVWRPKAQQDKRVLEISVVRNLKVQKLQH
jgi:hypothetical protein